MSIELASGPATVFATGSVTCFMGHGLTLRTQDPVTVELRFLFRSEAALDGVRVDVDVIDDGMQFTCINFDGADGRGSATPVLVGQTDELLVFLHFRVSRYGRTDDRTVHYTLYAVPKEDVGWEPAQSLIK